MRSIVGSFCPAKAGFRLRQRRILNFCYCTQDKFVMVLAPGHPTSLRYVGQSAHLPVIKFVTGDKFAAPIKFVPHDVRFAQSGPSAQHSYGSAGFVPSPPSPPTSLELGWSKKASEREDGKNCAIPSLHPMTFASLSQGLRRDSFLAKVPAPIAIGVPGACVG
jgi:hypothetical protein